MHRASRYRLYPNRTQERQFEWLCGAGRFVYNELLAGPIRDYGRFEAGEIERPGASEFDFGKRYTRLKAKEGNEWLRELSATVGRGTGAFPLGAAFAHFSRRRREGKGYVNCLCRPDLAIRPMVRNWSGKPGSNRRP